MTQETVFERAKRGGFVECTEEDFDYGLGVLPPACWFRHGSGFAIGEPYDSFRYYCFWQFNGRFWCALTTLAEARAVVDINEGGAVYDGACCVSR